MPLIPELVDYDPEGLWSLSAYVEGESMMDRLRDGKSLTEEELSAFRRIFDFAVDLYHLRAGIRLDLSPNNIILKGNSAYLVDLGTAHAKHFPPAGFEHWYAFWQKLAAWDRANDAVLNCALSAATYLRLRADFQRRPVNGIPHGIPHLLFGQGLSGSQGTYAQ